MPLWAMALAWWLLGERLGRADALRAALALGGAGLVLWPADGLTKATKIPCWLATRSAATTVGASTRDSTSRPESDNAPYTFHRIA